MAAQIEIEDVEPRAREVVCETAGRQVPCVTVLTEPVHQKNRPSGADRSRGARQAERHRALSHHRERNRAARYDDLFPKSGCFAPVHHLFDDSSVDNHSRAPLRIRRPALRPLV